MMKKVGYTFLETPGQLPRASRYFARTGRPRLLIVGCGDVGLRLIPLLNTRYRLFCVARRPEQADRIRALGAHALLADLDQPAACERLRGLASDIIYLAPPPSAGSRDTRSRHLVRILPEHGRMIYVSTTGVYGNCAGAWIDETRPVCPQNVRALGRVDAEQVWRAAARRVQARLSILRVPGIYAQDRLPLARLTAQTPALCREDDVYTNHIHADDLARAIAHALCRARGGGRVVNVCDGEELLMADYFDQVAQAFDMPLPVRLPRSELARQVTPVQLSFMSESRRIRNVRLTTELGFVLRYPAVSALLGTVRKTASP